MAKTVYTDVTRAYLGVLLLCQECSSKLSLRFDGQFVAVVPKQALGRDSDMHQGCPVAEETECPPVFQSRLASQSAIENLRRGRHRLEKRAEEDGGDLVVMESKPQADTQTGGEKSASNSRKSRNTKPDSSAA